MFIVWTCLLTNMATCFCIKVILVDDFCIVKPSKNPGEAKTLGLKNTKMPDYQAHGSLLLKFLKGVRWAILDGSEDLCFLIKITKRNTGPSLGSPLFVTSKKTRFWSKDLKDRRKLGLFKMQEKQEENLQTIWLKFEVFFVQKLLYIGEIYLVQSRPELYIKTLQYLCTP